MELSSLEIWAILGVLLLIIEIFAVSFFFMFFGVGAFATAFTTFLGLTPDLVSQLIVFVLVTVVSTLIFRKQLKEGFNRSGDTYTEMINEQATVTEFISKKGGGRVLFRGAIWLAISSDGTEVPKDAKVIIKKVDGIKLIVKALA